MLPESGAGALCACRSASGVAGVLGSPGLHLPHPAWGLPGPPRCPPVGLSQVDPGTSHSRTAASSLSTSGARAPKSSHILRCQGLVLQRIWGDVVQSVTATEIDTISSSAESRVCFLNEGVVSDLAGSLFSLWSRLPSSMQSFIHPWFSFSVKIGKCIWKALRYKFNFHCNYYLCLYIAFRNPYSENKHAFVFVAHVELRCLLH